MRTFGFAVATVLCAIQLTTALPRPDLGLGIDVFSADKTSAAASTASSDVDTLWSTDAITLTSDYATLTDILDEITAIGTDSSAKIKAVLDAVVALADATTDPTSVFDDARNAIAELQDYITSTTTGLSVNYGNLDDALGTNQIVLQLEDAFGELDDKLSDLDSTLSGLQHQVEAAVTQAGLGSVTKAILRQNVNIYVTGALTASTLEVGATLQLIFFILGQSKEFLQLADAYINDSGVAGQEAVNYIDDQLQALVDEVGLYHDAAADIKTLIQETFDANTDLASYDFSTITAIGSEADMMVSVYGDYLTFSITSIEETYTTYQNNIPAVSSGYDEFIINNGCSHIYELVTVLIDQGPYAEYCYEKYGDAAIALFEINARTAGQCVDLEITRLLTLQDVLISIAEQIAFSAEDLIDTLDTCLDYPTECNDSGIEDYLHNLASELDETHLTVLSDLVEAETDAGLARLEACFVAAKYDLVAEVASLEADITACEDDGPNN